MSKLFALTLLLPALAAANPLGIDEKKLKDFSSKARVFVLKNVSKETQRLLYQHLPGLFPLQVACASQTAEGKKQTYLPGDLVQSEQPLQCSGGLSIRMQAGSSIILGQGNDGPVLELQKGTFWSRFGKGPISVRSAAFELQAQGETAYNDLMFQQESKDFRILCTRGILQGRMRVEPSAAPTGSFLGVEGCRLSLKQANAPGKVHLYSGTVVHPVNIFVPRAHWPLLDLLTYFPEMAAIPYGDQTTIDLSYTAGSSPNAAGKLTWTSPFTGAAACTLFTQSQEGQDPVKAHEFTAANGNSSMALHPDYRKYWIALVCTKEGTPYISNLLQPAAN